MGYVEKNLMNGEEIVYEAQQHWIIYWFPILLVMIAIGQFAVPTESETLMLQIAFAAILVLWAAYLALNKYGGREYVLTNKRLVFKRGIITRNSLDLILYRCEGVKVHQSIMGRILNYGTVDVSTGEVVNHFDMIMNPGRFATEINQQVLNAKQH